MKSILTAEQMESLRHVETAALSNAIEQFGVQPRTAGFMGSEIGCLFPELGAMVGYAVPVCFDNTTEGMPFDLDMAVEMWKAIEASPKPAVVIGKDLGSDPTRSCHYGEGMTIMSRVLGAVGLVSDACVRDVQGIRSHDFQVFCRGTVASHGNFCIVSVGETVTVSGVKIEAGDLIHGDRDGAVLVPDTLVPRIDEVVAVARKLCEQEQSNWRYYQSPEFTVEGWHKLKLGTL